MAEIINNSSIVFTMESKPCFEKYTLHALECYLRGKQWNDTLNPFFTTNSPRFRNFFEYCLPDAQSTIKEIDIQMHTVHLEFKDLIEQHLYSVIYNMGLTEERFVELLEVELTTEDEAVHRLYNTLTVYRDFIKFGQMMQAICTELYPLQPPVASIETMKRTKICRVLWDIENVQVDPSIGGIQTVLALQKFLKHEDLMGNGIDTRISAFFNPYNKSLCKKIIEELNKASVELICASTKREDADRKLGIRINQEMQILIPELTTFVIISSDQDFRQHIQLLSNGGYTTIVVHEARHQSWRSALEMHASKGVDWDDVMKFLPQQQQSNTGSQSNDHSNSSSSSVSNRNSSCKEETSSNPSREQAKSHKNRHNKDKQLPSSAPNSLVQSAVQTNKEVPVQQHHYRDHLKEAAAVGWRVAICHRWVSAYGFLLVDISHPEVSEMFMLKSRDRLNDPDIRIVRKKTPVSYDKQTNAEHRLSGVVKVFVHRSAITHLPATQSVLQTGEYVLAQVVLDEKGPRAAVVKSLFPHTTADSADGRVRTGLGDVE